MFFCITVIVLGALLFYQDFGRLHYQPPVLTDPVYAADGEKIQVVCDPVCFFIIDDKRIKSRTDDDAAAGLKQVTLRFFDAYHGLIGYEDNRQNPNFFVIDTQDDLIQVVRLKLDKISFAFAAYYPETQTIQFNADDEEKFFYSANKPALTIL